MGIMYKFFIKHDIHVSTAWSTGARAGFGPKVSHYSALVSKKIAIYTCYFAAVISRSL